MKRTQGAAEKQFVRERPGFGKLFRAHGRIEEFAEGLPVRLHFFQRRRPNLFGGGGVFREKTDCVGDRFRGVRHGLRRKIGEEFVPTAQVFRIDDRNAGEEVFDADEHRSLGLREAEPAA